MPTDGRSSSGPLVALFLVAPLLPPQESGIDMLVLPKSKNQPSHSQLTLATTLPLGAPLASASFHAWASEQLHRERGFSRQVSLLSVE